MCTVATKRAKQLSLGLATPRREHGGEAHANWRKRKESRPLDPNGSLHVTMRSSQARNERSMLHPRRYKAIRGVVYAAGRRHGIVIERYVNVGNHLHLHLKTKSRKPRLARAAVTAFLREVGGVVARIVTGARKGRPAEDTNGKRRRFWDHLAWSRIVGKGLKELKTIGRYFRKNERDACHLVMEQGWPEVCLEFVDPGG
jgi:hypothetical protein